MTDLLCMFTIACVAAYVAGRSIGWLVVWFRAHLNRQAAPADLYDTNAIVVMAAFLAIAALSVTVHSTYIGALFVTLLALLTPYAVQMARAAAAPRWHAVNMEVRI